jgi:phenylacetate-CoA ligase
MELRHEAKRLTDVARAARMARATAPRERWPREQLERHQRAGVDAIVRHAIARSPFYRERFAGRVGAAPVELATLPPLDKATMMERFDDIVCDRRLRRDADRRGA